MKMDRLFVNAALLVAGLDRLSKNFIQARFELSESLPLVPGLELTYVRNPGAAFSMLANSPAEVRRPFFLLVSLVAVAALLWMLKSVPTKDRLSRLALGLVMGGALGNAFDRFKFGEVVDFILVDLGFWPFHPWPVFNVADSAVCVGVTLLIWRSLRPLNLQAKA